MPDNTSPFDDPLADLYGQLPEPRRDQSDTPGGEAPTSRRAAREARVDTNPLPAQPPITRAPAEQPAAPQRRAEGQPAYGAGHATTATAARPAATGTLDDLFAGTRSIEEVGSVPPPSEKRRRRVGGWIALAIVLVLVGGVAAGGIWAWNTFGVQIQGMFASDEREDFEPGIAHGEATITIVSGDAGPQVSQKLHEAGVTMTADSFYDYLIETSTAFTFQPGVFRMQQQMTSEAVLVALRDPASRLENRARLREGLTVEASVAELATQMAIPIEEFQAAVADPSVYGVAAPTLEGWLFPATYDFDPGATASDVIARLVARTVQSLDAAGVPIADRQRILTIASIIEREVSNPDDYFRVSRVIQNRLDQGMLLQMDSTAQYGAGELDEGSASTSDEAQFADNPWNTYVVPGLPVGPISNPGDLAIEAAMNPAEGSWVYFVAVNLNTGETVFSTTYEEHQAGISQMLDWCRNNPNSGC